MTLVLSYCRYMIFNLRIQSCFEFHFAHMVVTWSSFCTYQRDMPFILRPLLLDDFNFARLAVLSWVSFTHTGMGLFCIFPLVAWHTFRVAPTRVTWFCFPPAVVTLFSFYTYSPDMVFVLAYWNKVIFNLRMLFALRILPWHDFHFAPIVVSLFLFCAYCRCLVFIWPAVLSWHYFSFGHTGMKIVLFYAYCCYIIFILRLVACFTFWAYWRDMHLVLRLLSWQCSDVTLVLVYWLTWFSFADIISFFAYWHGMIFILHLSTWHQLVRAVLS